MLEGKKNYNFEITRDKNRRQWLRMRQLAYVLHTHIYNTVLLLYYICRNSSSHLLLLAGFQPEILNTLSNRTLSVGLGTSFRCHVIGNPKPRIKWKKNGVTIAQNKRIKVRILKWGSRLRIKNIHKSDEGVYRCIAKNHYGTTVSASAHVRIRGNQSII